MTDRILPVASRRSAPFWEAAGGHRLVLARCARCREFSHPPDIVCPRCHHLDPQFAYEAVSGSGVVRSWITMRQSFLPGFTDDLPFVLVDVQLDLPEAAEEVRLIGRLVDGVDAALTVGERVTLSWEDLAEGVAIPAFTLTSSTTGDGR